MDNRNYLYKYKTVFDKQFGYASMYQHSKHSESETNMQLETTQTLDLTTMCVY